MWVLTCLFTADYVHVRERVCVPLWLYGNMRVWLSVCGCGVHFEWEVCVCYVVLCCENACAVAITRVFSASAYTELSGLDCAVACSGLGTAAA